jgi:hypothetical protein
MVLIENEHTMPAIIFGDIGCADAVASANTTELILGGSTFRGTEAGVIVVSGVGRDNLIDIGLVATLLRAKTTNTIENSPIKGPAIGNA